MVLLCSKSGYKAVLLFLLVLYSNTIVATSVKRPGNVRQDDTESKRFPLTKDVGGSSLPLESSIHKELDSVVEVEANESPPLLYPIETRTAPAVVKRYKDNTLADQIEKALEKEFPDDSADVEGTAGRSFNNTVEREQGRLETVARVTHDKRSKAEKEEEKEKEDARKAEASGGMGNLNSWNSSKPVKKISSAEAILAQLEDTAMQIDIALGGISKGSENEPEDVARLIDAEDNEFVISNPKRGAMELQQDLRFISDLVVMIVCAATGGVIFACLGQPVITGYLLAGSICGPGGFGMVQELVQVETLAQFGVVFLLFALGVEFSAAKLRHVGGVAILGGLLQVVLLMFVCGTLAKLAGFPVSEGVFIGSFLSMSSTAVVLKCLQDRNWLQYLHGQIIIGTLILQDCIVGLLFALLPVLGGGSDGEGSSLVSGMVSILRELLVLIFFLSICLLITRHVLPAALGQLAVLTTQTEELYQLVLVAFCLSISWISDYLGLSIELGAFVAGVMISATDYAERTTEQIEPIRNIFAALFLASIGLIMNPLFLWTHIDILFASLLVVVTAKVMLTTIVVRAFGYTPRVSFTVGVCLAQIGEFAFVLLSRASNLGLVQRKLYLLLLGTTALSIVSTPLLFRSIPYLVRLATLMRWLRREESDEDTLPQAKRIPSISDTQAQGTVTTIHSPTSKEGGGMFREKGTGGHPRRGHHATDQS